jgi:hypothetical protein
MALKQLQRFSSEEEQMVINLIVRIYLIVQAASMENITESKGNRICAST